jgi:hypothetical protein
MIRGFASPADENDGRPIAYRPWPIACFHGNQKQNMFSKIRFFLKRGPLIPYSKTERTNGRPRRVLFQNRKNPQEHQEKGDKARLSRPNQVAIPWLGNTALSPAARLHFTFGFSGLTPTGGKNDYLPVQKVLQKRRGK